MRQRGAMQIPALSAYQYHSKPNPKIRAFIQAVKAYTGATKVDIVTHSMGVTLTRKAILGGSGNDAANGGSYNLGSSLTSSVDTFVGIAGANWGLFRVIKRAVQRRPALQQTDFIPVITPVRRLTDCRTFCTTSIIPARITKAVTFTRSGQPPTK